VKIVCADAMSVVALCPASLSSIALIPAAKAVDGKHRVMAKDKLMPGIAVFSQRCLQPLDLDMPLTSEAAPERVDEHHQQVAAPHEVGETRLPGGPLFGRSRTARKTVSLITS
jgi:hypothetical protein